MPVFTVEIQGRGPYQIEAPSLEVLTQATTQFSNWLRSLPSPEGTAATYLGEAPYQIQNPNAPQVPNEGVAPQSREQQEMQVFGRMLWEATRAGRPLTERIGDWTRNVGNALTFGNFNEIVAGVDQLVPGGMDFGQRLAYEDRQDALHRAENQAWSTGIDVAGNLATGYGVFRAGASPLSRARPTTASMVPRAAAEGAIYGALAGLGEGGPGTFNPEERLRNAAGGGLLGLGTGAALGTVGGTLANRSVVRRAPTSSALETGTDTAYHAMRQAGVRFNANSFENLIHRIDADLQGQNVGAMTGSSAEKWLRELNGRIGQAPTLEELDLIRRDIQQQARDVRNGATPNLNDARLLDRIVANIDDYVMDPQAPIVAGNLQEAQQQLIQGRNLAFRSKKNAVIQEAIDNAGVSAGMRRGTPLARQAALADQFRQISKDPSRYGMFSTEEQRIIDQIASGNAAERALANLGRLAPVNLFGGLAMVGPVAGLGGIGAVDPVAAGITGVGTEIAGRVSSGMTNQNSALVAALARSGGNAASNPAIVPIIQALLAGGPSQGIQSPLAQNYLNLLLPPKSGVPLQ